MTWPKSLAMSALKQKLNGLHSTAHTLPQTDTGELRKVTCFCLYRLQLMGFLDEEEKGIVLNSGSLNTNSTLKKIQKRSCVQEKGALA